MYSLYYLLIQKTDIGKLVSNLPNIYLWNVKLFNNKIYWTLMCLLLATIEDCVYRQNWFSMCSFFIGMHLLSGTISFSNSLLTGTVHEFFIGNIMNVEMVTHSHTLFLEYLFTYLINQTNKYILTWGRPWNLLTCKSLNL